MTTNKMQYKGYEIVQAKINDNFRYTATKDTAPYCRFDTINLKEITDKIDELEGYQNEETETKFNCNASNNFIKKPSN